MRLLTLAFGCCFLAGAAAAVETPRMPAAARKLAAAEIEALYRGASVVGFNFDNPALVSFSARIAATGNTFVSNVVADGRYVGAFELTWRLNGDQWCYTPVRGGPEKCVAVWRDGETIYEVNANGAVSARNIVAR